VFPIPTTKSPAPRKQLEGKSELDALIAYLQGMGLELKNAR
jgi:cbb3-type cytochrome oxidase cytochrome c subunit